MIFYYFQPFVLFMAELGHEAFSGHRWSRVKSIGDVKMKCQKLDSLAIVVRNLCSKANGAANVQASSSCLSWEFGYGTFCLISMRKTDLIQTFRESQDITSDDDFCNSQLRDVSLKVYLSQVTHDSLEVATFCLAFELMPPEQKEERELPP